MDSIYNALDKLLEWLIFVCIICLFPSESNPFYYEKLFHFIFTDAMHYNGQPEGSGSGIF
jgi:hypothetical protein